MIDLLGLHRADDADLVGDAGDVREQVGDLLARLAVLLEFDERPARLEHGVLKLGELLPLGERLGERLAVELLQLGLVVEALELRRAARHAEVDHPLGLDAGSGAAATTPRQRPSPLAMSGAADAGTVGSSRASAQPAQAVGRAVEEGPAD